MTATTTTSDLWAAWTAGVYQARPDTMAHVVMGGLCVLSFSDRAEADDAAARLDALDDRGDQLAMVREIARA